MKLKVGELYEVRHQWLMPLTADAFWFNCGPVLYLGEDVIDREDGARIVNHVVLAKGEKRLVDRTFLKFFEPLTSS
jgi:hypothetical protein